MTTPFVGHTVLIEGADAIAFAHAQFSSHVSSLARGQWQFSAWLDAQGRVRALFHLARRNEDQLLLLLRGGDAATLAEALRRYVFRARVSVSAAAPRALSTGPAAPLHAFVTHGNMLTFGCGDHSLQIGAVQGGDMHWRLPQLHAGWPWLPPVALDTWLPPALSLHRLLATVTDKGCYPGQEIIARLHFRGGHKRHLHSATLSRPAVAGERLHIDGRDVGCILDVVITSTQVEALIVVTDEAAAGAIDGRLDVHADNLVILLNTTWPA